MALIPKAVTTAGAAVAQSIENFLNVANKFLILDGDGNLSTGDFLSIAASFEAMLGEPVENNMTLGFSGAGVFIQRTATEEKAHLFTGLTANYALVTNGSGVVSAVPITGKNELYLPAAVWTPRTTNGCAALVLNETASNKVNYHSLDFDQTTQEHAQCSIWLPKGYNANTLIGIPSWTALAGTGTVTWGLQGRCFTNDDAIDQAFGTAQTSADTLIATGDHHDGPATAAITLTGAAKQRLAHLQMYRDVADSLNADAKFIAWVLQVTTDAATDD